MDHLGPVLLASGLSFARPEGGFALAVDHLQINGGESVALVGPSGCGKTTLLSLIAGILQPTGGSLQVLGQDQTQTAEPQRRAIRLAKIGMVFQEYSLIEYLNARDNLLLPLVLQGKSVDASDRQSAMDLLAALGLESLANRFPAALSTGECQRIAIGRALLLNPPLVLADEPTGSLDADRGSEVLELLLSACKSRGSSLLMVTHDLGLASRLDRTIDAQPFSVGGAQ